MLSYENKTIRWKKRGIVVMSCFLIIAVGTLTWMMNQDPQTEPTVAEDQEVILPLPDEELPQIVQKPFAIDAVVAVDYFDGEENKTDTFVKFEEVYRSSQGIDYTKDGEAFEIIAMMDGEVSDVREDELFGNTVVIQSETMTVTMQSLNDVKVKKGDHVEQGDVIASAGTCVYGKDLGNHLHLVVEIDGQLTDPENVYGKTAEEFNALIGQ